MKSFNFTIRIIMTVCILVILPMKVNADACDPQVRSVLTQQQANYVGQVTGLANQNFSRQSNSFALSTCLEKLMQSSGANLLFKPPTFQSLLNQVSDLVCSQAEDIFSQFNVDFQLSDGLSGFNVLGEVNLSGQFEPLNQNRLYSSANDDSAVQVNASIGGLFQ